MSRSVLLSSVLVLSADAAAAQCGTWVPSFRGTGPDVAAWSTGWFDSGSGPELYLGLATSPFFVGGAILARYGPAGWEAVPGAPTQGTSGTVAYVLREVDLGAGPTLLLGGEFTELGGADCAGLASYDGAAWTCFGSGPGPGVRDLIVFDAGSGEELHAVLAGFGPDAVQRWDGSAWSAVAAAPEPPYGLAFAIEAFDSGAGPVLYAGGFTSTAADPAVPGLARLEGDAWVPVPGLVTARCSDLAVADLGDGSRLFVAGKDIRLEGEDRPFLLASYDGASWTGHPGIAPAAGNVSEILDLEPVTSLGETTLLLCGRFLDIGVGAPQFVARFDGVQYSPLGTGIGGEVVPAVLDLASLPGAPWTEVAASGLFKTAGGIPAQSIARWREASVQPFEDLGGGCPGAAGAVPDLGATGCPVVGETVELVVQGALPGELVLVGLARSLGSTQLGPGCFVGLADFYPGMLSAAADGSGAASVADAFPPAVSTGDLFLQAATIDAVSGLVGATNAVRVLLPVP